MEFKRFLPKEGITISIPTDCWLDAYMSKKPPKVVASLTFIDVNDIADEEKVQKIVRDDPTYVAINKIHRSIPKGKIGQSMQCYVKDKQSTIATVTFKEYLDNPDGYGKGDFSYEKWITEPFQGTTISRLISSMLFRFIFMSGLANRLYAYVPVFSDKGDFWEALGEKHIVCNSMIGERDSKLPYIQVVKTISTNAGKCFLVEFDGSKYNAMDHDKYLTATYPSSVARSQRLSEYATHIDNIKRLKDSE